MSKISGNREKLKISVFFDAVNLRTKSKLSEKSARKKGLIFSEKKSRKICSLRGEFPKKVRKMTPYFSVIFFKKFSKSTLSIIVFDVNKHAKK